MSITVGRPRNVATTPAATVKTTARALAQQPTAEALDMAIASIMPPSTSSTSSAAVADTPPPSMVLKQIHLQSGGLRKNPQINTNTNTAVTPMVVQQQQRLAGLTATRPLAVNTAMHRVQLLTSGNQFLQIKPPGLSTPRMFTLNAGASGAGPSNRPAQQTVFSSTAPTVLTTATTTTTTDNKIKVYTVKPSLSGTQLLTGSRSIGSPMQYVQNSAGGQFITTVLKPQQQQPPNQQQHQMAGGSVMLGQKKFTLIRQQPQQQQPGTSAGAVVDVAQLLKMKASTSATQGDHLAASNIFDMPIVFADSDGNIQEAAAAAAAAVTSTTTTTTTTATATAAGNAGLTNPGTNTVTSAQPLVVSGQMQNRNIVVNAVGARPPTGTTGVGIVQATGISSGSGNKVVLINRPKGCIRINGNVSMLPASSMPKFTKVNVTGKGSISLPLRTDIEVVRAPGGSGGVGANSSVGTFTLGNKVNLISNAMIRPANAGQAQTVVPLRTTMGTFNVAAKPAQTLLQQSQPGTSSSSGGGPVVLSVDADKTTIKNFIKVGDTQIKPTTSSATAVGAGGSLSNTIVLKPGGTLRPAGISASAAGSGLLNRNVVMRKFNLVAGPQQAGQMQIRNAAGSSTGLVVRPMVAPSQGSQIVLQTPKQQQQQQQPPKPET